MFPKCITKAFARPGCRKNERSAARPALGHSRQIVAPKIAPFPLFPESYKPMRPSRHPFVSGGLVPDAYTATVAPTPIPGAQRGIRSCPNVPPRRQRDRDKTFACRSWLCLTYASALDGRQPIGGTPRCRIVTIRPESVAAVCSRKQSFP